MKTILVPLDGSTLAEQVLPTARTLAALLDGQLHLVQVVPPTEDTFTVSTAPETYTYNPGPMARQYQHWSGNWKALRQAAERYLEETATALRTEAVDVHWEVCIGHPAEAIVSVAMREHTLMIAMATHGYSGIKRWALGSVADKVLHAASVPVLVVRSSAAPTYDVAIKHILVPLDGSQQSAQALPLAQQLAQKAGATLTLVRAVPPLVDFLPSATLGAVPVPEFRETFEVLQQQADDELKAQAEALAAQHFEVTPVLLIEGAAEAIIHTAERCRADLIVMATHGYSGIKRWALGSVADKVLHASKTPLLLVRAATHLEVEESIDDEAARLDDLAHRPSGVW